MATVTQVNCVEFSKFNLTQTQKIDFEYKKKESIIFCIFIFVISIFTVINTYDQLDNHILFKYKVYVKQVPIIVDFLFLIMIAFAIYHFLPIAIKTIYAQGCAMSISRDRLTIYGHIITLEQVR